MNDVTRQENGKQKLARLEQLQYLDLRDCGLTDEVAAPLENMKGLNTLVLDGNPELSEGDRR